MLKVVLLFIKKRKMISEHEAVIASIKGKSGEHIPYYRQLLKNDIKNAQKRLKMLEDFLSKAKKNQVTLSDVIKMSP